MYTEYKSISAYEFENYQEPLNPNETNDNHHDHQYYRIRTDTSQTYDTEEDVARELEMVFAERPSRLQSIRICMLSGRYHCIWLVVGIIGLIGIALGISTIMMGRVLGETNHVIRAQL